MGPLRSTQSIEYVSRNFFIHHTSLLFIKRYQTKITISPPLPQSQLLQQQLTRRPAAAPLPWLAEQGFVPAYFAHMPGKLTALRDLAAAYGIDVEFWDWQGTRRQVADATLIAVLAAFGVVAADPAAQRAALDAHRRRERERVLPPCLVVREGDDLTVAVPAGARAQVELEDGGSRDLTVSDGAQSR